MLGPLRIGLPPGRRIFTAAYVQWDVVNPRDVRRNRLADATPRVCENMDLDLRAHDRRRFADPLDHAARFPGAAVAGHVLPPMRRW